MEEKESNFNQYYSL